MWEKTHDWLSSKVVVRIVAAERSEREIKKRGTVSAAMANGRNLDIIGYSIDLCQDGGELKSVGHVCTAIFQQR